MIDTHCHIYLPEFDKDRKEVLDRACQAGITDILMPAIDARSVEQMQQMTHPTIAFHSMAGVHPCEVTDAHLTKEAEHALARACESEHVVAVGETGLDYYWSQEHVAAQQQSLRLHCRIARQTGKPVVLHNRESTHDLLDILEAEQDGRLRGVWHCFSGTFEEARRALDLGLYLGIGGVVTFKNAGLDKVAAQLPVQRLLLETDAPYLAPVPYRGKRNEPAYIRHTAEKLAQVQRMTPDELIKKTAANARRLFEVGG